MSDERSAVLLVRVWLEDDSTFRARLMSPRAPGNGEARDDEAGDDVTVAVTSSPDDALGAIGAWMDRFIRGAVTD